MPDDSAKPTLLEQLRVQSETLRAGESATRRPVEEALQAIDRSLWRAFKWLDEALGHLEVIRPKVAHRHRLEGVLTLDNPQYDRGFVSYRRKPLAGLDVLEHIELFYRLVGEAPVVLKCQPAAAGPIEDKLRASHVPYHYQTEHDEARVVRTGVFTITPAITASVRFAPDYRRQVVVATVRNIDRFETLTMEFPSEGITEAVLEDLVRFILGEANTFLRRAPLAGVGTRRETPMVAEPPVYYIEKTARVR